MEKIETRSTSRSTAECSPIPLRQTDRVRLVFVPTLVENPGNPGACVRGHFVYQRKKSKDQWAPIACKSLSLLKSGEEFKLELHAQELLTLLDGLEPLYPLYRQRGIPRGRDTFVRLGTSLARFLALGEKDMTAFLEQHRHDAATTLLKLLKWLANSPQAGAVASRIAAAAPERLPDLTALLGLAAVKDALGYWQQHRANPSEEFWQEALTERAYVLSHVLAYPVVVIKSKAYVGGKDVNNSGGNVVDFIATVESTDAVVLIEIKTPRTPLLGTEYRDEVFPLSREIAGAVAQALRYRQSLMRGFDNLMAARSKRPTLGEPKCVVLAGNAARELTSDAMRENFELQRERLQGVSIITYDELFRRLGQVAALLQGSASSGAPNIATATRRRTSKG